MLVEILTFLALGLVLEGVFFALAPGAVARSLQELANWPPERLRVAGLAAAAMGVVALGLLAAWSGDGDGMAFGFPRLRGLFSWSA